MPEREENLPGFWKEMGGTFLVEGFRLASMQGEDLTVFL